MDVGLRRHINKRIVLANNDLLREQCSWYFNELQTNAVLSAKQFYPDVFFKPLLQCTALVTVEVLW